MAEPEMVILSVPLERSFYEALQLISEQTGRSAEELVSEAIAAAITFPSMLNPEPLGTAMLAALQATAEDPAEDIDVTEEALAAMQSFLLPDTATRLTLGDELIERLTGLRADCPPTPEGSARLEAVTTVCQMLRGTLSEAGVQRWWTRPRSHLHGRAPVELLSGGEWTPDTLAFREVAALADGDTGFAAT